MARHENGRRLVAQRSDVEIVGALARLAGDQEADHGGGVPIPAQMGLDDTVDDLMHPCDGVAHGSAAPQGPALVSA